ncbi:MAG: putative oxidoreductase [Janthinobacterium sp.]|jgi:predicted oxidoreductase
MLWLPLAGGRLFGQGDARSDCVYVEIARIADQLQRPFASLIFAWIMQLPYRALALTGSARIAAIPKPIKGTQLVLSGSNWFAILRAARGHEVA